MAAAARRSTPASGACSRPANGNVLVTETMRGRVFEVTRDSPARIVWDYRNALGEVEGPGTARRRHPRRAHPARGADLPAATLLLSRRLAPQHEARHDPVGPGSVAAAEPLEALLLLGPRGPGPQLAGMDAVLDSSSRSRHRWRP